MAPRGEIALTLSADEVQALKKELEELCTEGRTPRSNLFEAILEKIRIAEQKML
jgi:hypothetical protein